MNSNGRLENGDWVLFKGKKLGITVLTKGKLYQILEVGEYNQTGAQTVKVRGDDGIVRIYWADNFVYGYMEEDI